MPNRAEEIVEALPEPTPPAAPEPGTPLPPGDPGITPEEGSAINENMKEPSPGDPGIVPEEASPLDRTEPTLPAAPEPGIPLPPGDPGITRKVPLPEEGSAINENSLEDLAKPIMADLAIPIMADPGVDPIEEIEKGTII